MAAVEDLELRSVDITSTFTNGDLDEQIYMKQREGFHIGGPNKVCRLHKSLVENGMICPDFIPTLEMIADCLTKSVPAPKVCREQMGVLA